MQMASIIRFALLVLALVLLTAAACSQPAPSGGAAVRTTEAPDPTLPPNPTTVAVPNPPCRRPPPPRNPDGFLVPTRKLELDVALEREPALYQPVRVTVTVRGAGNLPGIVDAEAWMTLPPTAAFINGTTRWRGKLAPLDTRTFAATVAFVVGGPSGIGAEAFYTYIDPSSLQVETGTRFAGVVAFGDQGPGPRVPSSPLAHPAAGDGSVLVNTTERRRVLLLTHPSGWNEATKLGLPPVERWGPWKRPPGTGQCVDDPYYFGWAVVLLLIDQPQFSTGHHFAILRAWVGGNGARLIMDDGGVGDPERITRESHKLAAYTGPTPMVLDLLATSPLADWPVETRQVSPYQVLVLSIPDEEPQDSRPDQVVEVMVRVNGQVVGRQTVVRGPQSDLVELPLGPF